MNATTALVVWSTTPNPGSGGIFNDSNIWALITFIGSIVLAVVGIGVIGGSRKGKFKDAADTFGGAGLGIILVGLALGGIAFAVGGNAADFFFGG